MNVFLKDVRKKTESLRESELLDLVNPNHSRIYFSTLKSLQPGRGLSASAWGKGLGSSGEGKDEGMEEDDDDDDNDEDDDDDDNDEDEVEEEDDGGGRMGMRVRVKTWLTWRRDDPDRGLPWRGLGSEDYEPTRRRTRASFASSVLLLSICW